MSEPKWSPRPDGDVVNSRKVVVDRLIVTRRDSFLRASVELVDGLEVAIAGFERAGGIVDCFGPGDGVEERQAVRIALLEFHLERVVRGKAGA